MPLSNTPLDNPLTVSEREAVCSELETVADSLLVDPYDPSFEAPEAEQIRLCQNAARDSRKAAAVLTQEIVGFNEVSHARNILGALTAEIDEERLDYQRLLRGAAAKLHAACESVLDIRRDEYVRELEEHVQTYGFTVQHVLGENEPAASPPFSFTIGLTQSGFPELVTVGLGAPTANALLNDIAHNVLAGAEYGPGIQVQGLLKDGRALLLSSCPEALYRQLSRSYKEGVSPETLQVLWPDVNGLFPSDPDVDLEAAALQEFPDWDLS